MARKGGRECNKRRKARQKIRHGLAAPTEQDGANGCAPSAASLAGKEKSHFAVAFF
jgi:hypothetical protein